MAHGYTRKFPRRQHAAFNVHMCVDESRYEHSWLHGGSAGNDGNNPTGANRDLTRADYSGRNVCDQVIQRDIGHVTKRSAAANDAK
jgi:hypothetical protein